MLYKRILPLAVILAAAPTVLGADPFALRVESYPDQAKSECPLSIILSPKPGYILLDPGATGSSASGNKLFLDADGNQQARVRQGTPTYNGKRLVLPISAVDTENLYLETTWSMRFKSASGSIETIAPGVFKVANYRRAFEQLRENTGGWDPSVKTPELKSPAKKAVESLVKSRNFAEALSAFDNLSFSGQLEYKKKWEDAPVVNFLLLHLKATAEVGFTGVDDPDYFNSVIFQGVVYTGNSFDPPTATDPKGRDYLVHDGISGIFLVGGSSAFEATEDFGLVDYNGGLSLAGYLHIPWLKEVATWTIGKPDGVADPGLYLECRLTGVERLTGGDISDRGPLEGMFHVEWIKPLIYDIDLGANIPKIDVDLIATADLRYDFFKEELHDKVVVGLRFAAEELPGKPALTFTYATGEAAPKFENIGEFLAGVQISY